LENSSPLVSNGRHLEGDYINMLDGIPIAGLTAPALLGLAVLMLLLGRIVPRSTLQDKAKECEQWRLAYEAEREARAASVAQTVELLELAKTTHDIIVAIFYTKERLVKSGGADALQTK
jgi:hypothetical protein